jgi:Uma2 family endonuclease
MGMPDTARRYTVEDVLAFPDDGNRYELVDGELLVTPAPSLIHQKVVTQLFARLAWYLDKHVGLADVLVAPADITWDREKLVQPDLFVIPASEVSTSWKTVRTLLLAVEIVSPSSARGDRLVKRRLYQRQRVATYWIVDPDARLVEVWHPDDERPEIVTDVLRWRAAPDADDLAIDLQELFDSLPK